MAHFGDMDLTHEYSYPEVNELFRPWSYESGQLAFFDENQEAISPWFKKIKLRLDGSLRYRDKRKWKSGRWWFLTGRDREGRIKPNHVFDLPYLYSLHARVGKHIDDHVRPPRFALLEQARTLLGDIQPYFVKVLWTSPKEDGVPEKYMRISIHNGEVGVSWSWNSARNSDWTKLQDAEKLAALAHCELADQLLAACTRSDRWWIKCATVRNLLQAEVERRARLAIDRGLIKTKVYIVRFQDDVWVFHSADHGTRLGHYTQMNAMPDVLDLNLETD
jgi:hypothetical protein